jgi:thymidylate kinase
MLQQWGESGFEPHFASVERLSFPAYETVAGRAISKLLKAEERDPVALQSLMTVNRLEFQDSMRAFYGARSLLVLDRYWLAALVYGVYDGIPGTWLRDIHRGLIQPDLWVILSISAKESFRRRPVREDAYEADRRRLERVSELYLDVSPVDVFGRRVMHIDGTASPQAIHRDIIKATGDLC